MRMKIREVVILVLNAIFTPFSLLPNGRCETRSVAFIVPPMPSLGSDTSDEPPLISLFTVPGSALRLLNFGDVLKVAFGVLWHKCTTTCRNADES